MGQIKTYEEALRELEKLKPSWEFAKSYILPMAKDLITSTSFDSIELNIYFEPMSKKEILITLDELFWSRGIETGDLYLGYESLMCDISNDVQKIWLCFTLKEGGGCQKVVIGTKKQEIYEWRCT